MAPGARLGQMALELEGPRAPETPRRERGRWEPGSSQARHRGGGQGTRLRPTHHGQDGEGGGGPVLEPIHEVAEGPERILHPEAGDGACGRGRAFRDHGRGSAGDRLVASLACSAT
jgi:hypothetical protein